jgi:hypothetical protein
MSYEVIEFVKDLVKIVALGLRESVPQGSLM